jgi:hypothetical protein
MYDVHILHNRCREAKEKAKKEKKNRCCRRHWRRVDSLVSGGYDRTGSNGGGLLRLQTDTQAKKKKRE